MNVLPLLLENHGISSQNVNSDVQQNEPIFHFFYTVKCIWKTIHAILVKEGMLYIPHVECDTLPITITFNLVSYNAVSYKEHLSTLHLHDVIYCVAPVQRKKKKKTWESNFSRKGKKLTNIHF